MRTDTALEVRINEIFLDQKGSKTALSLPGAGMAARVVCQPSASSRRSLISATFLERTGLYIRQSIPARPGDGVQLLVSADTSSSRRKIHAAVANLPGCDFFTSQEDYRRIFSDRPAQETPRPQSPATTTASESRARASHRRHRVAKGPRGASSSSTYGSFQSRDHAAPRFQGPPSPPATSHADSFYEHQPPDQGNPYTTYQGYGQWNQGYQGNQGNQDGFNPPAVTPSTSNSTYDPNFPPESGEIPECPHYVDYTEAARKFWSWDEREQKWKHVDHQTGEVLYCPDELD